MCVYVKLKTKKKHARHYMGCVNPYQHRLEDYNFSQTGYSFLKSGKEKENHYCFSRTRWYFIDIINREEKNNVFIASLSRLIHILTLCFTRTLTVKIILSRYTHFIKNRFERTQGHSFWSSDFNGWIKFSLFRCTISEKFCSPSPNRSNSL